MPWLTFRILFIPSFIASTKYPIKINIAQPIEGKFEKFKTDRAFVLAIYVANYC